MQINVSRHKYSGTSAMPTNSPIDPLSGFQLLSAPLKADMHKYTVRSARNATDGTSPFKIYDIN